ncbi:hypothetical protein FPSE_10098 [Fusarium pseudograminearum CS3096]|uniref:F-box domain-containing protein n=1 Tax=Fusarium pseudograminearum (strain CS3096) TaxID=1028729 RepID=K3V8N8_FUSPC|nr:hypothetical protein FPSE_10098 [Fusarium pseudograminearum CS3096]EKJ69684.1 hypothetical protein FPSE_10098 [Fusarium pseudograminearum CS3096]
MSLRRSSRLAKTGDNQQEMADLAHQVISLQPKRGSKRKIEMPDPNLSTKGAPKTAKTKHAASKTKKPCIQSSNALKIDRLSNLPPEILSMVVNNIREKSTLSRLSRTCKKYYLLIAPLLYKRISVAAMFHGHIAKLIRTLEPHLSIQQRKQLKKEGTYKGQKDIYPSGLRPDEMPVCANHVRQLVIGSVQAGRNHDYIVHRYIEEALKNTANVEILESFFVTESMAKSIAKLEKLQALSLDLGYRDYQALYGIKNLKHLALQAYIQTDLLHSLLLNSRSTLRSLNLNTNSLDFFYHFDQIVSSAEQDTENQHYFTALKSLTIQVSDLDSTSIRSLMRATNFAGLQELHIEHLPESSSVFFQQLADLFSTSSTSGLEVRLRDLKIDMRTSGYNVTESQQKAVTETKTSFLNSFDTLKSLELFDYGQYPLEISENPGLPNSLVQAILQHKGLERLSISYNGIIGGYQLPYLTPSTIGSLIDNLPLLREIDIAPEEHDLDQLGSVLSRASNIERIVFSCTSSWASHIRTDDPTKPLLHSVLKGFLCRSHSGDAGQLKWEEICKLRFVTVNCQIYEIASKFGKGGKGIGKPEKFTVPGNPKREVMFRNITGTGPTTLHVGFDPTFQWVEKVSKDLD